MLFGKKKKRPRYGSKPNGDWRIVLQRKLDNSHSNWITVSLITYLSTCEEEFCAHGLVFLHLFYIAYMIAYLRVRQTAFSLFPGHHFLLCILLSMVIRMFKYHVVKNFIVALVYDQAPNLNLLKVLDYLLNEKVWLLSLA